MRDARFTALPWNPQLSFAEGHVQLGILVLGHLPPGVAALATGEVRFQARWKLSGDPLLVQIGEKLVTKAEPAQRTPVDVVESALVWGSHVWRSDTGFGASSPRLKGCTRLSSQVFPICQLARLPCSMPAPGRMVRVQRLEGSGGRSC